jgi:glycosyltransferase involved in cell wall biosynthesis
MYNAADLMVNSSRSEGWCNAIAEARAAGTPVVATDVGGNREQIVSDALGLVVPDGDERALTDAIVRALRRPWNRHQIAAHGSVRTWQHVAEQVHQVFKRVVETGCARDGKEAVPACNAVASG